jgi:pyruvate dehydrogenase E1 component
VATRPEIDDQEAQEWVEALHDVLKHTGEDRAHHIIELLISEARRAGINLPFKTTTAYINTIEAIDEERLPGDPALEHRVRSLERWNALAMVVQSTNKAKELGGHISTYASAATLYSIGFNHFFKGGNKDHTGDLVYFQGHASPGIYARAYLEGRITEEQMKNFRRDVDGNGLTSYPHPWIMPDFWQFPTVSMGLGPITGIYQARFMKYLQDRSLIEDTDRKVWVYTGDGEMDEPESLGAISLAARENLDNLIFVVNCNLQRLDGPVRGNGKIIQELEGVFRGAGWNVIKLIWGGNWDPLFAQDKSGIMLKRMEEALDGDYQNYRAKGGAYVREHFFGKYPELAKMVEKMTDEDIWRLNRGGHDQQKVYAAYASAVKHKGQPTVILAKTVKGYGLGHGGESLNIAHGVKKLDINSIKELRDRYRIPIPDEQLADVPFYKPDEDSPEIKFVKECREKLGGPIPARLRFSNTLTIPGIEIFEKLLADSGDREYSTTMSFVRIITALTRDKNIKERIVPIIPDEARTFGMEGMFRTMGIYSRKGQLYETVDADELMFYREDKAGQILQEGINEAGAMSSWIAAATSYSNHNTAMIPFYIFYSMFGFQRIGDLAWLAADSHSRGFLLGGTAGRTTLAGEGLQHQDGQSHIMANFIPNCRSYDPTFGYELAVIIHDGLVRMYQEREDCFYYITVMNENYKHPAMPKNAKEGIIKGMYLLQNTAKKKNVVQLLGSGTILREVMHAAQILEDDYSIGAKVWSVTSFNELYRDGIDTTRWNMLHPNEEQKQAYVTKNLQGIDGPVIAATDYVKLYGEQIRSFVPTSYRVLGTDGFGRSDTREKLREYFEVDYRYVLVAALYELAQLGKIKQQIVDEAIQKYEIDADRVNPMFG